MNSISSPFKKRIFSGVQPTGNLQLGNYLGALKNFVPLQDTAETLFCIVDQHAITAMQNPADLKNAIRSVTASFIASGLDPDKAIIFNQSKVPEHTQLAWVLNCVARMGWLNRMTQFKDKAGKNREQASVGLFTYPVLMAADILLYKTTHVPVGDDQRQHLELARDIAIRFNQEHAKANFFPEPETMIPPIAARIMSLRDGTAKMSKSDPSDMSRINMTDDNDMIAKKFRKAKTDADDMPKTLDSINDRHEVKNLYTIYSVLANISLEATVEFFATKDFKALKQELADVTCAVIAPIRDNTKKMLTDVTYIDAILNKNADKARMIAKPVLQEVHDIMGFI
ncbi:MAG: tryptophanyl-tRNA synthetase [Alphaproteobacteria bacterium]|jgi:tryptophanyl-tRNA synthetase